MGWFRMGRLKNKVVIITGASRGQGLAEAQLFAKEGAKVAAADILFDELKAEVEDINSSGGNAIALKLDVSSEKDWKTAIQTVVKTYGKVDVLVNNAAIITRKSIEETELEHWDNVMNVNAKGTFLGMKSVLPEMKKNGKGSIVNISSIAALRGGEIATGDDFSYTASKGAIASLSKNAAHSLGKYNIRVNSVHPGVIHTPMIESALNELAKSIKGTTALPQGFGDVEDIAKGVLYLASDESKYVTGSQLVIDGGYTSQ